METTQLRVDGIRDMFNALVPGYDRFNSITSLGLDSLWRKRVAGMFKEGSLVLDIGTGTGQLARAISRERCRVVGVDFSEAMIEMARNKHPDRTLISFQVAQADNLPFTPRVFDGITSAFVIRNLYHAGILGTAFREFYRVLKPGGQIVHLELTRPRNKVMALGHMVYLKTVLPVVGKVMFRSRWPKNYLSETIFKFPEPELICQQIRWAGFERATYYPLFGGVATLFIGARS
jgi:demethylmenaquinone methyltransferase / 2-methoxy-6-polyprenyl-1,4-benzoquinol methylase